MMQANTSNSGERLTDGGRAGLRGHREWGGRQFHFVHLFNSLIYLTCLQ